MSRTSTYLVALPALVLVALFWLASLPACTSTSGDEACNRDSQCPTGFACRSGMCLVACDNDGDCSPGETCQVGVCRPGQLDMGGDPDVGAPDLADVPDASEVPLGVGPDGQPIFGAPAGADCAAPDDCRPGLDCLADVCQPAGDGESGDLCVVSGECGEGLACGAEAACVPSSGLGEGGACSPLAPSECGPGLRCVAYGLGGVCLPEGERDIGRECVADTECLAPLLCSAAGTCAIPAFGGIRLYGGRECADLSEEGGAYRVFFEVPRGGEALDEFYRLPYPNDIRLTDDGIDMAGHPVPEDGVVGAEIVGSVVDAVAGGTGFSPAPTIIFRFSADYDFGTITITGSEDDGPTLRYINIDDAESPRYGRGPTSINWFLNNGRTRYLCDNSLSVRGSWHQPLAHGETYVVYLTNGVTSTEGQVPEQDDDFAAMLAETVPDDADLISAWEAYAPFRAYLASEEIDPETIAAAAVFTTMDPDALVPRIREAVRGRLVTPSFDDLTLCEDGATSPCDDGESRVCLGASEDYLEVHGTYRVPMVQEGTRPYVTPAAGGGLAVDDEGDVESQGSESVCLSLTIPVGEMPENGWPVVLFAHGSGGDFLSHLRSGVAETLADVPVGQDGASVQFATIGIDGVLHGPRRGDSLIEPELLFFNVENPAAAVGNVFQGAADYFALTQLVEIANLSAEQSPTDDAIRFDPAAIYFFGHSQGATIGAPFVAYEPAVDGAVFSGAGASLVLSLLNKQSPLPVADAVSLALNDGTLRDSHPVLSLVQQAADQVDPLHYNALLVDDPPIGLGPTHLFVSYGLGDTYTPDPTIEVFGSTSGVEMALPTLQEVGAIPETALPVSGNRTVGTDDVTAVMVVYEPDEGDDGHFVAFRVEAAVQQIAEFLGTAVFDGVPTVSAVE